MPTDLLEAVLNNFVPRFVPGGRIVYAGSPRSFSRKALTSAQPPPIFELLANTVRPDVIVFDEQGRQLTAIDIAGPRPPMPEGTRAAIRRTCSEADVLVRFVTAFHSRSELRAYITQLPPGSNCWFADEPSHMIHFDSDQLAGPYFLSQQA